MVAVAVAAAETDMSGQKVVVVQSGGFLSTLCLIFIVFKLLGVISWSWWYVTMPLWIMPVALIAFSLGLLLFVLMAALISLVRIK